MAEKAAGLKEGDRVVSQDKRHLPAFQDGMPPILRFDDINLNILSSAPRGNKASLPTFLSRTYLCRTMSVAVGSPNSKAFPFNRLSKDFPGKSYDTGTKSPDASSLQYQTISIHALSLKTTWTPALCSPKGISTADGEVMCASNGWLGTLGVEGLGLPRFLERAQRDTIYID
ncbi:uncharacterized protein BDR25DRAFT_309318 [Lindgomyces ingoldianus]|uniref:Uncharacterized protein n=1 Tax=Lindgomyces ingoldianus TaxID=673940 RepID=A0ACB6RCX7_9PLEO|nr:uncharacterized protein BDR25DRAFT_309318 [Lindgomyces ingoldianus]KAF2476996.1 hypothetical protein BDR25DRAFT_309318 [Lindgomyces ingoldianus]